MLHNDLSKELVLHFAEKLKSIITYETEEDRNLIKKGLLLYRQGSVYNVSQNDHKVDGRVQDIIPVDVTLDLDFLDMSTCTCPSQDFCRHKMAVFFYMYSSVDRIGSLLEEWKAGNKPMISTPKTLAITKIKDRQKEYTEISLQSWIDFFNKEFSTFERSYPAKNHFFFSTIYHSFFQVLKRKAPLAVELKKIFLLHSALFCMNKIIELINDLQLKNYQIETYVKPYFHNFTDIIFENCNQLNRVSLPFSLDSLIEESIEPIRNSLLTTTDTPFQFERLQMYRLIWATLLHHKKLVEQEETYLSERESSKICSDEEKIAVAHLHFLQKDDMNAIATMEKLSYQVVPYSFWWIGYLTDTKEWKRARLWIEYTLKNIPPYISGIPNHEGRRRMTRSYLKEISGYAIEHDDSPYVAAMKQLIPYSYMEYSDYLIEAEDYRKWVELQMLAGYEIGECDRYDIKLVEENDRQALLPFYHHAIMNAIELKNRASYKKAVKYLKRVRTQYKRLKKEDVWESYITTLAASKKRLRAFQEELLRASLIVKE
ncbi:SWIM zinc finger family protein [Ferdinandcohnia quinoae]|uniref:SWIM zinc finger domain-containing protein n=1 Tax=Fredinandcohnia quinoae TaxID=2918902 RepID=A0AAW5E330_9BACI|nr:SWIM zinc finger family protein [Fredinandcohnia sp. SECRCQ15]MCH1625189.1 SWIM zinc finger domain-containing protein [Fredinandcohnia sp. SECRCQ15]